MGGSSLAPDVLAKTFGADEDWLVAARPRLDRPGGRGRDGRRPRPARDALHRRQQVRHDDRAAGLPRRRLGPRSRRALRAHHAPRFEHAGELIVAITDPGKSIEAIPHHDEFREVFLNPPDIGGRYSALTYVGLVPASLIGLDLDALLASASAMLARVPRAGPGVEPRREPRPRDRDAREERPRQADVPRRSGDIASFGAWVGAADRREHRQARRRDRPGRPRAARAIAAYGDDRVFVRLALVGRREALRADADALAEAAAAAGHPVIRIEIADPIDLGAEFVRWEVATAIAGAVLGIDPFDQPNVEEAKERTRGPARRVTASVGRPRRAPIVSDGGLTLYGDAPLRLSADGDRTLVGELAPAPRPAPPQRLPRDPGVHRPDRGPRRGDRRASGRSLRDATRCATTAGYGPRFLHSTGQLHKGGAPIGWFLQLTSDHPVDRPIPGWPYTFGRLIDAQAQGDFEAIESHDLPILRVHLADPETDLPRLEAALAEALLGT